MHLGKKYLAVLSAAMLMIMVFQIATTQAQIPNPTNLWTGTPPGSKGIGENDKVYVWAYPATASNQNGSAIIICPGGGYSGLATSYEGHAIARWANGLGMSAFVLKYRLSAGGYQHPIPMWDAQRAMRWVRAHANEFKIDTARIGILGFSAGGHLASTAGTHFDDGNPKATDSVDRVSSRPAFQILIYPVITMDKAFTHGGSRTNLLGNSPSQALVDSLSNEKQVTTKTPPAFLVHTKDDNVVPVRNSEEFEKACKAKNVPVEYHSYPTGPHGFGMADGKDGAPNIQALATWPGFADTWLKALGVFEKPTSLRKPIENSQIPLSPISPWWQKGWNALGQQGQGLKLHWLIENRKELSQLE